MTVEFEDHCWKDVVTPEILKTYTPYHRETYIGQRPALLAIDLYNLAYEGGAKEPHELVDTYKSSCGVYAHNAIKPTQELFALARSLKIPVFYTTTETRKEAKPGAVHATNRQRVKIDPQAFEIKEEFKPESGDVVIFKERASGFFGTPLVAHLTQIFRFHGCTRSFVVTEFARIPIQTDRNSGESVLSIAHRNCLRFHPAGAKLLDENCK